MRNMSFMLTAEAVKPDATRDRERYPVRKDVTRRLGWAFLKPGQLFQGVRQARGLKQGQHVERLFIGECVSNTPERLDEMLRRPWRGPREWDWGPRGWEWETVREGFPSLDAGQFVTMFCGHMSCEMSTVVNRIEYRYVK